MTSASESAPEPTLPIAVPYTPDPTSRRARRRNLLAVVAIVGFCLLYGMGFALMGLSVLIFFLPPMALTIGLVIWAAPDTRVAPIRLMTGFFYAFTAAVVLWPAYLAVKPWNLPSLTVTRMIEFPLLGLFVICLGVSAPMRRTIGEVMSATPLLWKAMAVLVVIETYSIVFAHEIAFSIEQFILAQMNWTAMFFMAAYIFSKPGRIQFWAVLLWVCSLVAGAIGVFESLEQHVLWFGHIPSFLQVQDIATLKKLSPHIRFYTTIYRVQSTFNGPMQYAEFMGLSLPFVAHFMANNYKLKTKILAFASMAFLLFTTMLTHSRTGGLGIIILALLYPLYLAVRYWKRRPKSMIGPLVVYAYPVVAVLALGVVLAVGRLRNKLFGGGETAGSTNARFEQWHLGMPKILANPIGHGIGTGGYVLGFVAPDGSITIDSYFLSILLELGVIGFLVYYGMFAYAVYRAGRAAYADPGTDREMAFLAPAAISLVSFVAVKVGFSEQDNHPLFFMSLGMIAALLYRLNKSIAPPTPKAAATPPPARPSAILAGRRGRC